MPPPIAPSRDLLFGLLALQNGLINQVQLVAAFQAWTLDKARALADHLTSLGHLNDAQKAVVEAIADLHVAKHGDVERSLAAISAGRSTHESLARLGDPDIEGTLARVRARSTQQDGETDADRTATYSVGTATSEGQRFRVLRPHARGGLGAVFVALDTELHREVALKQILDSHADEPVSRQRFLLEAEVTGGLEHPGIVPVYGLGTYGDGRPYYAMRFIRGHSLKEAIERFHADEASKHDPGRQSLELRKLLRRFTDVCNAIEYAHSRGVLHRDIKPGNVIVGKHGETLVVDWGLAKATGKSDPSAGERTLMPSSASASAETLPGSALGTPAYMSPEQAEGQLDRLGPRSDVYSLGGTLYCLLTGRPPFAGDDIGSILLAVQRGEFRPPRIIDPSVDRALEAVCLKAMAHKPTDRYATPRALAEDVERWMADEPVSAWREPLSRRAGRWGRRNRTAVAAAGVALVVGVVGLGIVAGVQAHANSALQEANAATEKALGETREAKKAIDTALAETRKAQAETKVALAQSEESRQQAEAVSTFLVDSFRSPDPSQIGREVKVADVLDRAAEKLDKEFAGSRATKGALLEALGLTYRGLGLYDRAVTLHAQARAVREAVLGPDHPDTLQSRSNLGLAYWHAGRSPEAIALLEATVELQRATLGPGHPDTLTSRNSLAIAYHGAGQLSEAIPLYETTLNLREAVLGPDHPDTLQSRNTLANAYWYAGRLSEAIPMHRATLNLSEARLGPDHPLTLKIRNNLAGACLDAGRLSEAVAMCEVLLRLNESKLGPSHPGTLINRNNLAEAYESLGRWTEAEGLLRDTLARRRKAVPPDSPLLADDLARLGRNQLKQERWSEVEPLLREALTIVEKVTPDLWDRYDAMSTLGDSLLGQGRYADAEPLVVQGYEGMKTREQWIPVQNRSRIRAAAERVVRLYEESNKPEQATAWKAKLGLSDLPGDVFARP